jgi:AcrR family transcriptional regulator
MPCDDTPTPTTRLPADQRRAAILESAALAFGRGGLHGVTTRELARACGVTEPVIYQHFDSKQALFLAVVCDMLEQATLTLQTTAGSPPETALQQGLDAILLWDAAAQPEPDVDLQTQLNAFSRAMDAQIDGGTLAARLGQHVLERVNLERPANPRGDSKPPTATISP